MVFRRKFFRASVDISSLGGREPGSWGTGVQGGPGYFLNSDLRERTAVMKEIRSFLSGCSGGDANTGLGRTEGSRGEMGRKAGKVLRNANVGEQTGRLGCPWR